MLKTGTRLLCFSILFFGASFSYSNAQVYTQLATSSAAIADIWTANINCSVYNNTIEQIDVYMKGRSSAIGVPEATISFDGVKKATTTITKDDVYRWYSFIFNSQVSCTSGTSTILITAVSTASGNFTFAGTTTVNSTISSTTLLNRPSTIRTTPKALAMMIYSGTPPTPDPIPHPNPPPIQGALITRNATTTCVGSSTSSTCSTAYIPEFYYLDWIFVNMIQIFLLSFMVIGYFMNRTLKN